MSANWHDNTPIYRQLKDRILEMLLDGALKPGDAIPSVRQIAAQYQLNPITVSRAYQELVDEGLVEKQRGLGMYVLDGAREKLLASERERFLQLEWPAIQQRMLRLEISESDLIKLHNSTSTNQPTAETPTNSIPKAPL
jgi:GntR family transcriptional regulator